MEIEVIICDGDGCGRQLSEASVIEFVIKSPSSTVGTLLRKLDLCDPCARKMLVVVDKNSSNGIAAISVDSDAVRLSVVRRRAADAIAEWNVPDKTKSVDDEVRALRAALADIASGARR